ncbi:hypothetical protein GGS24DRAFT_506995 [Hypoxylon argillaceum]|nr:hypothetical protein GGS24DRAFT_506995 [Hypoxylon argillaceum]
MLHRFLRHLLAKNPKKNANKNIDVFKNFWIRIKAPTPHWSEESVCISSDVRADFLGDMAEFIFASEFLEEKHVPRRRGPPETGKSYLCMVAATVFRMRLYILSLSLANFMGSENQLNELLDSIIKPSILLLEDIDAADMHEAVAGTGGAGMALGGDKGSGSGNKLNSLLIALTA